MLKILIVKSEIATLFADYYSVHYIAIRLMKKCPAITCTIRKTAIALSG